MSQLSYDINQGVGASGQIADVAPHTIDSKVNPTDAVTYGRMLALVAGSETQAALPTSGSDVLIGVAVREMNRAEDHYTAKSVMAVLKKGRIYVEVEEAVTVDSDVYVRFAAGAGGTELGIFRTDADTASAVAVANARYLTNADANGFAVVDLSLV